MKFFKHKKKRYDFDRYRLKIEMIPHTSWGQSLANKLPAPAWDKIRQHYYEKAGWRCEICGTKKHGLHADEMWYFDNSSFTQLLIGIQAICRRCHNVRHIGRSMSLGLKESCVKHLRRVNRISKKEAYAYIDYSFQVVRKRSNYAWYVKIDEWFDTAQFQDLFDPGDRILR